MKIFNHNTHPIFEADQVLTSHHLNDMFNYLEEQERMTRAKLIGSGIVCGLEVSLEKANDKISIHISKGLGITSQGHLIAMEKEANNIVAENLSDKNVYSYYKEYVDPINLDDSIQSNDTIYPFFKKDGAQIKLYELHDRNEAGFELLSNFLTEEEKELEEFGVLLYLECYDKELKNCIENDCNEKGVERTFTLRKLLVSKDDLRDIICAEEALNVPKSYDEIDNFVNARYYLKPIHLERLRLSTINTETQDAFFNDYQNYLSRAVTQVYTHLSESAKFLVPILIKDLFFKGNFNYLKYFQSVTRTERIDGLYCYTQFVYDYLCDISETHNELVEAAFDMISQCCPPLDRFPKHLRLGDLNVDNRCIPSPYRTTFTQSPIHNHGHQKKEKVLSLFRKVKALIVQFRLPRGYNEIKITPSAPLSQPLSKRAIPYYYQINKDFLRDWNYDYSRKCRLLYNHSYHSDLYENLGIGVTPEHVLNPLKYGLNGYDFFRIEGHICKKYNEALQQIQSVRDQDNLPFDVIALKLSRDAEGTTFDEATCNFKDLKILCEAWKSELQCLLGKVINKLSSIKYRDVIIDPNNEGVVREGAAERIFTKEADFSSGGFGSANILGVANLATSGDAQYTAANYDKKRVFGHVSEQVAMEKETIGYALRKAMTEEKDICRYDIKGTEYLHAGLEVIPGYNFLTYEEDNVAFIHPLNLSVAMLDFSNAMDKECHEMDMEDIEKKLLVMNQRAALYIRDLNNQRKLPVRNVNIDFETMIQITSVLSTNCSFATLKEIQAEMERRKVDILKKNLFSEYLKKNPGVDHKSGVPKGGTFILVYADEERNNVIIQPDKQINISKSYLVRGKIKDHGGEALIGANILIKGTTIGTVTDLDGNFELQVPRGKQALVISYVGYQSEEVILIGASTISVTLGQQTNIENSGKVIADFYVPYLCCSDCPPVTYIFPEGEEILPEELVDLDIIKKNFCAPTTRDSRHIFIVTPVDGTVIGDGVDGNPTDGFFFDPNAIDLGDETFKIVAFKVNEFDVPLTVRVEKMPNANFESAFEWRQIDEFRRILLPMLDLKIEEYDPRFEYFWTVYEVAADGKRILLEKEHVGNPDDASVQTYDLSGLLGPVKDLLIELKVINGSCSDVSTDNAQVTDGGTTDLINFVVAENGDPITNVSNKYKFSTESQSTITIQVTPSGEFVVDEFSKGLALKRNITEDRGSVIYSFTPSNKKGKEYLLTYKTEVDSAQLIIEIEGIVSIRNFTDLPALRALGSDAKIVEALGTDGIGYLNTVNLAHVLIEKLRHPAISKSISEGKHNDEFVTKLAPAMEDVSSKVIDSNNSITTRNNAKQSTLLGLYEKQVTLMLDMVAIQRKDIEQKSELSKMFTPVNAQLNSMKKAGIKINVRKRLQNTISAIDKSLKGKPNAKKRFKDLLKTVTS